MATSEPYRASSALSGWRHRRNAADAQVDDQSGDDQAPTAHAPRSHTQTPSSSCQAGCRSDSVARRLPAAPRKRSQPTGRQAGGSHRIGWPWGGCLDGVYGAGPHRVARGELDRPSCVRMAAPGSGSWFASVGVEVKLS